MRKPIQRTDEEMRARALARWEGEGGALAPPQGEDALDATEMQILARLGAALLEEWARLPEEQQSRIARRAARLGEAGDRILARSNLAVFLGRYHAECDD